MRGKGPILVVGDEMVGKLMVEQTLRRDNVLLYKPLDRELHIRDMVRRRWA